MTLNAAKSMSLRLKSAGAPSEAQMAAIATYTLAPMTADQLYVRTFILGHNCIDRDMEAFDEGLLANFKATLPGKGAYIKHPQSYDGDSGPAEGRWFSTDLQTMTLADAKTLLREPGLQLPPDRSMVTILFGDAYFAKTSDNQSLLTKVDAGIAGDVSLGFGYDHREAIKDAAGNDLQATRLYGPGAALEASLIWLGAQPGARAVKNARSSTNTQNEDSAVDLKEAQTQLTDAQTQIKALTSASTFTTALKAALVGSVAGLAIVDDAKAVASAIVAGIAYKSSLVAAIVTSDRQKGLLGDKPEEVAEATESYNGLSLAHLEKMTAGIEKNAKSGSQLGGGDPNPQRVDMKAVAAEDAPLLNPLLFN